jgi:hypothetical protein
MSDLQRPTPLTDLRKRAPAARATISELLGGLLGPCELSYDFFREWNGCWRVRVEVTGRGRLEFTLLDTPGGGILAMPRPLPERWRTETGIRASDGSLWTLDAAGELVAFPPGA